jgi:hypothetical protein
MRAPLPRNRFERTALSIPIARAEIISTRRRDDLGRDVKQHRRLAS